LTTFETGVINYWVSVKVRFHVEYFRLLMEVFEQSFSELMANVKNIRSDNENNWSPVDLFRSQDVFLFLNVYFPIVCSLVLLLEIFLNYLKNRNNKK